MAETTGSADVLAVSEAGRLLVELDGAAGGAVFSLTESVAGVGKTTLILDSSLLELPVRANASDCSESCLPRDIVETESRDGGLAGKG